MDYLDANLTKMKCQKWNKNWKHYINITSTKNILQKQSIVRCIICDELCKKLKSKKCTNLILHGDDKEAICGASDYQIEKVKTQGKHVLKALEIMENIFVNEGNITWKEACE